MDLPVDRSQAAWWAVGAVVLAVLALFVHSFIGTVVLGLFIYYAARPIHHRLRRRLPNTVAATLTMALLVVPSLVLLGYVVVVAVREFAEVAGQEATEALIARLTAGSDPVAELVRDPVDTILRFEYLDQLQQGVATTLQQFGVLATGVVHLTLALALAFFLYRDGERLRTWFSAEIGGPGTAPHAFLTAIDRDLQAVYFGNLLTVILVTGLAVVVYNGFNLLSPALRLPFPTLLALLTGLATFVPLVVGKIVYLPAAAYLGFSAVRSDVSLVPPIAFLLIAFLLLDLLPQSFVRPYVSGRTLHMGLILFAYVLGTALFGWYGLFYGPLLAVVVVQFFNVVFPELVRGEPVTAATASALGIGSEPPAIAGSPGEDAAGAVAEPVADDHEIPERGDPASEGERDAPTDDRSGADE